MPPKRKSQPQQHAPAPTPSSALAQLDSAPPLKLAEIAETLNPKEISLSTDNKRSSAVSDDSEQNGDTHPAALEADLAHYKVLPFHPPTMPLPLPPKSITKFLLLLQELFTKLRFSYVEQSTKEKYLRAITSDPPLLVTPQENTLLETQILALKSALQAQKQEIRDLLAQLAERGKTLSTRYAALQTQKDQLRSLPVEISELQNKIAELKASTETEPDPKNPHLSLPLPETEALLQERQTELDDVNAELARLQATVPRKAQELEKLERELRPLETQKQGTVQAAKEARRRKEEGGGLGDELEERGRWLRASEMALREMLEVD